MSDTIRRALTPEDRAVFEEPTERSDKARAMFLNACENMGEVLDKYEEGIDYVEDLVERLAQMNSFQGISIQATGTTTYDLLKSIWQRRKNPNANNSKELKGKKFTAFVGLIEPTSKTEPPKVFINIKGRQKKVYRG